MKKVITLVTAAALTLSVTACTQNKQQSDPERTPERAMTGVANPIHEGSPEEVAAATGILLKAPYGAEDVRCCSIDGTPAVAQMKFTLNGHPYTYRVAAAEEDMDISGMYYDWTETEKTKLWNCEAALLWNEDGTGLIRWFDRDAAQMYSLSMDKGATRDLLFNTAGVLFIPAAEETEAEEAHSMEAEYGEYLTALADTVRPGSAGSSLRATTAAGKLADLLTIWSPDAETLRTATERGTKAMAPEDAAAFFSAAADMTEAFEGLFAADAAEAIEAAGIKPEAENWDEAALLPLLKVIRDSIPADTVYRQILAQYQQALNERWDHAALLEAGLVDMTADLDASGYKLGYRIGDLDADGTPELMIATKKDEGTEERFFEKMVFALYTLDEGGSPLCLKDSRERDRMYYAGGTQFAEVGSSGAADSFEDTLTLQNGAMIAEETHIDPSDYVQPELTLFG